MLLFMNDFEHLVMARIRAPRGLREDGTQTPSFAWGPQELSESSCNYYLIRSIIYNNTLAYGRRAGTQTSHDLEHGAAP